VGSQTSDDEADRVFRALADPTRRLLLDRLRESNGQTLTELCSQLNMARQSVTQHLDLLEQANLISTVRRGRQKLHYLNPVPIHRIQQRWIVSFEQPRLAALAEIKRQAEESIVKDKPDYVYVTYIQATPESVWQALTSADLTAQYWGHSNVSDWHVGSIWVHERVDGSQIVDVVGTVLDAAPPRRLVITFDAPETEETLPAAEDSGRGPSVVTFDIEPFQDIVKLTVTHDNLADREALDSISSGWPAVMANLKSLLETGRVLSQPPWEMPPSKVSASAGGQNTE
jgi:uncharacterized protein YndB with AHSA1/START domain